MSQQLLFGELYRIEEEKEEWIRIRTHHDGYPCWIERKQSTPIENERFETLKNEGGRALPLSFPATDRAGNRLNLVAGSLIHPSEETPYPLEFPDGIELGPLRAEGDRVLRTAERYIRTPYLWGGRSPFGLDCSGFVQTVLLLHGIRIHRDASDQVTEGRSVSSLEEAKSGDLAFFQNQKGKVVHVGILDGKGHIVHASGMVRIDPVDEEGIIPEGSSRHSHTMYGLRRVL